MKKDFDKWNILKKEISKRESPFFSEKEIWISHALSYLISLCLLFLIV